MIHRQDARSVACYDKWIDLDHVWDAEKAAILKNALEAEWAKYVFIDPKFRPNDKLEEVTTSHDIHVQNVHGKMSVNFIVRTRNSCPRYHNDLIKKKANELFGDPMPPMPAREIVQEPVQITHDESSDDELKLEEDSVSEISSVPSIPKLTRQHA